MKIQISRIDKFFNFLPTTYLIGKFYDRRFVLGGHLIQGKERPLAFFTCSPHEFIRIRNELPYP